MSENENAASDSCTIQDGAKGENKDVETVPDDVHEFNEARKDQEVKESEELLPEPSTRLGDVLERIQRLIATYIKLPSEELAMLVAVWIAGTYCYKQFQYYGYLSIRSATPRCGKSQLLRMISLLSAENPPITSFPTAAVLYRNPRKILIMDEVDQLRDQDKETYGAVLSVLNSGFERGAVIERLDKGKKDQFEVKRFEVFGPKAFAGIERLADTLADRTFAIVLKRVSERMPRFRPDRLKDEINEIRELLTLWANEHEGDIFSTYTGLPTTLEILQDFDDRFQDIAEPLCTLAMLADQEYPQGLSFLQRLGKGLRAAMLRRQPTGREGSFQAFLNIVSKFISYTPYKRLATEEHFFPTEQLLSLCEKDSDLSWIGSGAALAGLLRRFDLSPISNGRERGYRITRKWYNDWRTSYPKPTIDLIGNNQTDHEEAFPQIINY